MTSPIHEQAPASELFSRFVDYLYANSRPQFHTALFLLVWAAVVVPALQLLVLAVSLIPSTKTYIVDYELIGTFIGCGASAELVRCHVKQWIGYSVDDWCYSAMLVGGAVFGAMLAGKHFLMWGVASWLYLVLFIVAGSGFYVLMGWLFHLSAKEKLKQQQKED